MSDRPTLPRVSQALGRAAHAETLSRVAEGHSQSHESDAAGGSHHYQTPRLEDLKGLMTERMLPQSARHAPSISWRTPQVTTSLTWSVQTDTTHSQGHSQTPEPPDTEAVQRVIEGFTAAAQSLAGQGAVGDAGNETAPAPQGATRKVGQAVRANLGQSAFSAAGGLAGMSDGAHNNVHSESGGGGGGGSKVQVNEMATGAMRAGADLSAGLMHDNVHSESGHGSAEQMAGQVSQQLRSMAGTAARRGVMGGAGRLKDAMHDNVHSESGHGGGSMAQVSRSLGPQAQRAARQSEQGAMHDNVHSETGHGAAE